MMSKQAWQRAALALALLVLAQSGRATIIEKPFALRSIGDLPTLQSGESFELQFVVDLKPGSRLNGIEVAQSDGIGAASLQSFASKQGDGIRLQGIATRTDGTVELMVEVDGEIHFEQIDLGVLQPGTLRRPLPDEFIVDSVDPSVAKQMWKPEPSMKIEVSGSAGKYNIHAYGRFVYLRPVSGTDMTTVLVGVDGAEVHLIDEDGFDNTLATAVTDPNGYWDINVAWGGDPFDNEPDLAVKMDSGNSTTQVGPNSITTRYWWRTPVLEDFTGSELNIGTYVVAGSRAQTLHIHSTMVRAYRWYASKGYSLSGTAVHWPDSGWSYYTDWNDTIHMLPAHSWNESVMTHELGHHYVHQFSSSTGSDYCNGICDSPDRCGHCGWCAENINDAWGEGFPNFIAMATVEEFDSLYSPRAVSYNADTDETVFGCGAMGLADPTMTENALAAVLRDLYDDDVDSDPAWFTGLSDNIQMPSSEFFAVSETFGGTSSTAYLGALRSFVEASPSYDAGDLADFWEVTQMNGFDMDAVGPSMPTPVVSNSHTIGVSNPNNFPYMLWTASSDDFSGVDHYMVSFSPGGPGIPTIDIGDNTWFTPSAPLTPGNWWFNVRAVDRAGNPSGVNSSFGPIVIAPATALNLAPYHPEFWEEPGLPSNGSLPGTPSVPTTLVGYAHDTYAHFAWRNTSPSGFLVPAFRTRYEIDGISAISVSYGAQTITGSKSFYEQNVGPFTVRGGRHMFVCSPDADGNLAESSETDNWYGQQWIWSAALLTPGSSIAAGAPGARTGGFNKIPGFWFNRDGYAITQAGWWNAVVMESSSTADYSLSLHAASTGAENGFAAALGYSARPAGAVEAVFSNKNNYGGTSTQLDIGIVNENGNSSSYTLKHLTSAFDSYGSTYSLSWDASDRMELREFYVAPTDVGPLSPEIQLSDPAEGPVHIMLLDQTFTLGDIFDYVDIATTDESGFAQLNLDLSIPGYYCLVFYRDPPGYSGKKGAVQIDVQLAPTLTNLEPDDAVAGWAGPFVPRPAADGTYGSVPLPGFLPGDVASTYYNFATVNSSLVDAAGDVRVEARCDGVFSTWVQISSINAGNTWLFNSTQAQTIPAGRHTLSMTVDSLDGHSESSESDNVYGAQWIWDPSVVPFGPVISRPSPRDPFGGLEDITVTVIEDTEESGLDGGGVLIFPEVWPNCDGVRSPQFSPIGNDGYWAGFALMSENASNADLRLHEMSTGATKGFEQDLAQSNWGTGESDLVFANFNYTTPRVFDAGVVKTSGSQNYDIQPISSVFLDGDPVGRYGQFTIDVNHVANLHEVYLSQDNYVIALENRTPGTRLGFSVHGPLNAEGAPYFGKSELTDEEAISWIPEAGPQQYVNLQVGQGEDNFYCIAVWKVNRNGLKEPADYYLEFHGGATSTPDAIPTQQALLGIAPNPFNPYTQVKFELDRPAAVRVELFDLRGARVREQSLGEMPAGTHEWVLHAVDDRGASLASGRYLLQLWIGEARHTSPVTLIK